MPQVMPSVFENETEWAHVSEVYKAVKRLQQLSGEAGMREAIDHLKAVVFAAADAMREDVKR